LDQQEQYVSLAAQLKLMAGATDSLCLNTTPIQWALGFFPGVKQPGHDANLST